MQGILGPSSRSRESVPAGLRYSFDLNFFDTVWSVWTIERNAPLAAGFINNGGIPIQRLE
jgi:hypothetical protein